MVTFDVKDKVGEQPWIPSDDDGCSREMWLTLSRVLWLARNIREYPPAEACPFKQTNCADMVSYSVKMSGFVPPPWVYFFVRTWFRIL